MLVLESLEHALARGAKIYAEITGYGATSDGFDMVAPSGEGALRCMKMAMANLGDRKIQYINTHGTSTHVGDLKEVEAMKNAFGDSLPKFSSTKSMTGHSLGAAGVQEAIYSLLMLRDGFIAPTINAVNLEEPFKGLPLVTSTEYTELDTVMSNSFGFGGTNACLVFSKYKA